LWLGEKNSEIEMNDLITKVITIQVLNIFLYGIIDTMKGALYER